MTGPESGIVTADWFGDRAVMIRLSSAGLRSAVVDSLQRRHPDLVVRAGMDSVLVEAAQPAPGLRDLVRNAVAHVEAAAEPAEGRGNDVTIPVSYTGEDLAFVAEALGTGVDDIVRAHQRQRWTVAMMGFAPGFAYLVPLGLPVLDWSVLARRDHPRHQVPVGSVAIAAGMSAVYPAAMPGGWHLIGHSPMRLFDAEALHDPTALHPGDEVAFREERR